MTHKHKTFVAESAGLALIVGGLGIAIWVVFILVAWGKSERSATGSNPARFSVQDYSVAGGGSLTVYTDLFTGAQYLSDRNGIIRLETPVALHAP